MTASEHRRRPAAPSHYAGMRLGACLVVGLAAGGAAAALGLGAGGAAVGWAVFCATLLAWTWAQIGGMDAAATRAAASREDPSRRASSLLTVLIALVSALAVLAFVVLSATTQGAMPVLAAVATLGVIALSWAVLQTEFTLRYAHLYYRDADGPGPQEAHAGGLDFNQAEPPRYLDFAYYAFTIGMTYQTADVNVVDSRIRAVALGQALVSFVFGTVLLAATVNLVAGIGQSLGG